MVVDDSEQLSDTVTSIKICIVAQVYEVRLG